MLRRRLLRPARIRETADAPHRPPHPAPREDGRDRPAPVGLIAMPLADRESELRAWMVGGLDGDPARHEALLRAIRPLLAGFFRRRVGPAAAEDLAQEVLIAVHEHRRTYDRGRPFLPWLFAIARHKLVDHFRRARPLDPIERAEALLRDDAFEPSSNARLDVATLLATVSEKQARAIRDTWLRGLSVAEAARGAGIGESDVKVSAHRGLRALQARWADPPPETPAGHRSDRGGEEARRWAG